MVRRVKIELKEQICLNEFMNKHLILKTNEKITQASVRNVVISALETFFRRQRRWRWIAVAIQRRCLSSVSTKIAMFNTNFRCIWKLFSEKEMFWTMPHVLYMHTHWMPWFKKIVISNLFKYSKQKTFHSTSTAFLHKFGVIRQNYDFSSRVPNLFINCKLLLHLWFQSSKLKFLKHK